ncbi:trypsin-like peptidase domain-containing protein [Streptomyces carpinensis]|uniref:Trypsin-like peptidase domain-containing protein n=1 Tax=Streptomyces carpinensis TaxID=66369 RepID=A0ABV1W759_9ACTN|nr:trypsin-like peptidase domain-containing protein [Streptomyces carpinensis]
MKRTSGIQSPARHVRPRAATRHYALFVGLVLIAVTSASVASASDGPGPLGVTAVTTESSQSARIGALFGADKAGSLNGNHFCTASVVHSPNHNLVLTAAHCLSDDTDLVFAPGYRDGKAPYGVWTVKRRFLPDGWSKDQDEDSDVAFAVISPQGGRNIEDVVGGNRFVSGVATGATAVTVTGYPDSREVPITCTNRPRSHSRTQQRIDCPEFTGGTSGSPWINGDRQVVGVLGGHEEGGSTPDTSYSVVFGAEAAELYKDAAADP